MPNVGLSALLVAMAVGIASPTIGLANDQCKNVTGKGNGPSKKLAKEAAYVDFLLKGPRKKTTNAPNVTVTYKCHEASPGNHRCTAEAEVCWW